MSSKRAAQVYNEKAADGLLESGGIVRISHGVYNVRDKYLVKLGADICRMGNRQCPGTVSSPGEPRRVCYHIIAARRLARRGTS